VDLGNGLPHWRGPVNHQMALGNHRQPLTPHADRGPPRALGKWAASLARPRGHTGAALGNAHMGNAQGRARDPQGSDALKTSVGFVLVVGVVLLLAGAHSGLLDGYGASQLVLT